jgi:hypothetical protein
MKMKNKRVHIIPVLILFFGFLGVVSVISSCKKDGPARAEIIVVDVTGAPVEGATVTLHQDTLKSPVTGAQATISDVKTTDSDGKTSHEFPLEAILNVDVVKGKLKVSDYIRLEKSSTVSKTVSLK